MKDLRISCLDRAGLEFLIPLVGYEIREAALSVLGDSAAETRNMRFDSAGEVKQGIVIGVFENVEVAVSIRNGEVTSAYPTWDQKGTTALDSTYDFRSNLWEWSQRIDDLYRYIESKPEVATSLAGFSPNDLIAIRRGERVNGFDAIQMERALNLIGPSSPILTESLQKERRYLIEKINNLRRLDRRLSRDEAYLFRSPPR